MYRILCIILLSAIFLSACASPASQAAPRSQESCVQGSIATPPLLDLNKIGEFRTATIALFNADANGMSFLIRLIGKLWIVTIRHIADLAKDRCGYVYISGVKGPSGKPSLGTVDYKKFVFSGPADDQVATYPLSESFASVVEQAIKDGALTPLELSSTDPKIGDFVAIPRADTGLYTKGYQIIGRTKNGFWIAKSDGSQGIICEGRSGGPVLATSGNNATRQVVGVVSSISQEKGDLFFDEKGRACSLVLYFAPVH